MGSASSLALSEQCTSFGFPFRETGSLMKMNELHPTYPLRANPGPPDQDQSGNPFKASCEFQDKPTSLANFPSL